MTCTQVNHHDHVSESGWLLTLLLKINVIPSDTPLNRSLYEQYNMDIKHMHPATIQL